MHKDLEAMVNRLFSLGAVKVDLERGFSLKAHRDNPALPRSPIYVELGTTSNVKKPGTLGKDETRAMARLYWELALKDLKAEFRAVAGVPDGGTAPARMIVEEAYHMSGRQLEYLALAKSEHSKNASVERLVSGLRMPPTNVVLIEDAASSGKSIEEAAAVLRKHGHTVTHAVAFLNRLQGARTNLQTKGIDFRCVITFPTLLKYGERGGHITSKERMAVLRYLNEDKSERIRALAAAS